MAGTITYGITTPTPPEGNWWVKFKVENTGEHARLKQDIGCETDVVYAHIWLHYETDHLDVGEEFTALEIRSGGDVVVAQIRLRHDDPGDTLQWVYSCYDNGVLTDKDYGSFVVATDTRVEFKYDIDNETWAVRINTVVEGSGSISGTLLRPKIMIPGIQNAPAGDDDHVLYIDRPALDTDAWIGPVLIALAGSIPIVVSTEASIVSVSAFVCGIDVACLFASPVGSYRGLVCSTGITTSFESIFRAFNGLSGDAGVEISFVGSTLTGVFSLSGVVPSVFSVEIAELLAYTFVPLKLLVVAEVLPDLFLRASVRLSGMEAPVVFTSAAELGAIRGISGFVDTQFDVSGVELNAWRPIVSQIATEFLTTSVLRDYAGTTTSVLSEFSVGSVLKALCSVSSQIPSEFSFNIPALVVGAVRVLTATIANLLAIEAELCRFISVGGVGQVEVDVDGVLKRFVFAMGTNQAEVNVAGDLKRFVSIEGTEQIEVDMIGALKQFASIVCVSQATVDVDGILKRFVSSTTTNQTAVDVAGILKRFVSSTGTGQIVIDVDGILKRFVFSVGTGHTVVDVSGLLTRYGSLQASAPSEFSLQSGLTRSLQIVSTIPTEFSVTAATLLVKGVQILMASIPGLVAVDAELRRVASLIGAGRAEVDIAGFLRRQLVMASDVPTEFDVSTELRQFVSLVGTEQIEVDIAGILRKQLLMVSGVPVELAVDAELRRFVSSAGTGQAAVDTVGVLQKYLSMVSSVPIEFDISAIELLIQIFIALRAETPGLVGMDANLRRLIPMRGTGQCTVDAVGVLRLFRSFRGASVATIDVAGLLSRYMKVAGSVDVVTAIEGLLSLTIATLSAGTSVAFGFVSPEILFERAIILTSSLAAAMDFTGRVQITLPDGYIASFDAKAGVFSFSTKEGTFSFSTKEGTFSFSVKDGTFDY